MLHYPKKEQRNEPGFYTLIQDDLFSKTLESGKNEYQKLFQIIENNKTEEDEDTIICKQSEITYVFNKQSNVITSLGLGIKIFLWPHGKIESFWY